MKRQAFAQDCLKVAEQTIIESNLLEPDTLAKWRKDAVAQVDDAVAAAQKEAELTELSVLTGEIHKKRSDRMANTMTRATCPKR